MVETLSEWQALRETVSTRLDARVVLYVNPFLTTQAGHDGLFQQAQQQGYLVENGDVWTLGH